jgi:Taurine catabolism dioxygenase TauD, TfdA family
MPSVECLDSLGADIRGGNITSLTRCLAPLVNSGSLNKYTYQDLTPVIGREFDGLQVTELLNSEEYIIRDLAVTISERGVVFLRNQKVSPQQMKDLMERITRVAGCVRLPTHTKIFCSCYSSRSHQDYMYTL